MKSLAAIAIGALLAGCSKAPEPAPQAAGPDNAVTRYAENLSGSEQKAQDAAAQANAVMAQQQQEINQATGQGQ
jgi:hypothetical protein